jgi:hypothetical protein
MMRVKIFYVSVSADSQSRSVPFLMISCFDDTAPPKCGTEAKILRACPKEKEKREMKREEKERDEKRRVRRRRRTDGRILRGGNEAPVMVGRSVSSLLRPQSVSVIPNTELKKM